MSEQNVTEVISFSEVTKGASYEQNATEEVVVSYEEDDTEVIVVPEVPKVISDEQIYVYVPIATNDTKGIASFDKSSINIVEGVVSVNDDYVNNLLDNRMQFNYDKKVDKLTTEGSHVYSHTGEIQEEIAVSTEVHAGNIVKRLEDGGILVPDDTVNEHSAVSLSKVNRIATEISQSKVDNQTIAKNAQGELYVKEFAYNGIIMTPSELVQANTITFLEDGE